MASSTAIQPTSSSPASAAASAVRGCLRQDNTATTLAGRPTTSARAIPANAGLCHGSRSASDPPTGSSPLIIPTEPKNADNAMNPAYAARAT
jgi:hypothetical protein